MNQSIKNGFCPKCGALMRQNVCQSCEFSVNMDYSTDFQSQIAEENAYSPIPQPVKKKKTGLVVGIIIGVVALFLLVGIVLIVGVYLVFNYSVAKTSDELWVDEYLYEDISDYEYDYEYEENDTFENYGNEITEPAGADEYWQDIWDTPESLE